MLCFNTSIHASSVIVYTSTTTHHAAARGVASIFMLGGFASMRDRAGPADASMLAALGTRAVGVHGHEQVDFLLI